MGKSDRLQLVFAKCAAKRCGELSAAEDTVNL